MVLDGLNWVTSPAAWCVEPLVSSPFSISRMSFHPARARWRATLQPAIPPPITTTCLRMRSPSTRVAFSVAGLLLPILRRGGRDAADRGSLVSAAEALAEVFDLVPELAGPGRTVVGLPGGLTNANYKVTTGAGCFVVRCWTDDTGLLAI